MFELNNHETTDRSDLIAIIEALEQPDDPLLEALSRRVDLDAFFTHWALEVITGHWDGYAGNLNNNS